MTSYDVKQAKHLYESDVKAKSRKLVADLIERHTTPKQRKSMNYVCLPGPTPYEIEQIPDKLGIPRDKVVGIERDGVCFEELQRLDLGIELYRGTALDFFYEANNKKQRYNVVSLDFTGKLTLETILTSQLAAITLDKKLGFIHLNVSAAREAGPTKELLDKYNLLFSLRKGVALNEQELRVAEDFETKRLFTILSTICWGKNIPETSEEDLSIFDKNKLIGEKHIEVENAIQNGFTLCGGIELPVWKSTKTDVRSKVSIAYDLMRFEQLGLREAGLRLYHAAMGASILEQALITNDVSFYKYHNIHSRPFLGCIAYISEPRFLKSTLRQIKKIEKVSGLSINSVKDILSEEVWLAFCEASNNPRKRIIGRAIFAASEYIRHIEENGKLVMSHITPIYLGKELKSTASDLLEIQETEQEDLEDMVEMPTSPFCPNCRGLLTPKIWTCAKCN